VNISVLPGVGLADFFQPLFCYVVLFSCFTGHQRNLWLALTDSVGFAKKATGSCAKYESADLLIFDFLLRASFVCPVPTFSTAV